MAREFNRLGVFLETPTQRKQPIMRQEYISLKNRYSCSRPPSQASVAAFTTVQARSRTSYKTSSDLESSLSFESIDSGKFSDSQLSSERSDQAAESRRSNIKRVIISEKIAPYQLKIQQSKGIKLTKLVPNSRLVSRPAKSAPDEDPAEELSEEDIEFLLANTGFSLEQIKNWNIEFVSKCAKGQIGYDQFKVYYKLLLPEYLSERKKEDLIKRLFRLFDIDNDGYLNYSEFLLSFWIRCRAPIREKFTWIFNMLDLDRNGFLNYSELHSALSMCTHRPDLEALVEQLTRDVSPMPPVRQKSRESIIRSILCEAETDSSEDSDREEGSFSTTSSSCRSSSTSRSYSETEAESFEAKLHTVIVLLDTLVRCTSSVSPTLSLLSEFESEKRRVNMSREQFLIFCERYEPLRKLIIPIRYFYDASLNSNDNF